MMLKKIYRQWKNIEGDVCIFVNDISLQCSKSKVKAEDTKQKSNETKQKTNMRFFSNWTMIDFIQIIGVLNNGVFTET